MSGTQESNGGHVHEWCCQTCDAGPWTEAKRREQESALAQFAAADAVEGTDWLQAERDRSGVQAQNARGEWVPAIPEPLFVGFGLRKCRCGCGETFKTKDAYRGHYALAHVLALR